MGPSSVKGHSQPDSADGCPATDLVAAAEGLREVAAELDPAIAERADELVRRMRGGSFRLAFCGGFSNGKSTLINALLGSPVLPVGVLPVTAVPTEVVAGREVAAEIELEDGRSVACPVGELARWVSEADNPGNTKGVARVVVSTPSPLLSGGLTLVDTPGLESIFGHNDMEALATIRDAEGAIVVLSADSPVTAAERRLLDVVAARSSATFFVLNRADHLRPSELAEAVGFVAAEVAAALGRSHPVFALSARDGFDAAVAGDRAGVTASGLARLSGALSEFLASELVDARLVAFGRAVSRLVDGIEDRDALERSALALSDAELADRLVRFTAAVDAEMRSLAEDRVLLAETVHEIDRDLTAWFAEAGRQIPSDASARFEALSTTVALRQLEPRLDAEVQAVVEERFGAVRPVLAGRLDAAWAEVAQVFATKAQARVDAIRASAGAEFGTTLHPVHLPTVDEEPDRFWFLFSRPELPDADLMRLLRLLLPHRLVRRRLVTAANRRLALELDKHAGRARADLSQRLAATHRRLEAELVTFVTTVAEEIHRATASAVDQRRDLADRDSALAARSRRVHDAVAAARTACARTAGQGPRTPPAT